MNPRTSPVTRLPLGVALVLAAPLLATGQARADEFDTVNVTLGASSVRDDNLFRLPSSAKSDTISSTTLGLKFAKNYSLQRLELEGSVSDYRYQTFSYLNFTATNYTAAWRWSATPRLHGNLTTSRSEALNSFADYRNYDTRNIRTDETSRFDGIFDIGPWQLLGAVGTIKRSNSQTFLQEGDNTLDTVEGGVGYSFPSGALISAVSRHGRGEYFKQSQPNPATQIDNRFDQDEQELRLTWPITGKTQLDGRLAHVSRQHAHFADRDYAGTIGNLDLRWMISAKTSLVTSLAHELASYQTTDSSYSRTDRVVVSPLWQISEKTRLRLRYDYARRDYLGPLAGVTASNRQDTLRVSSLALEWQPLRTLFLSASLAGDRRESSTTGFSYDSKSVLVSAQISF